MSENGARALTTDVVILAPTGRDAELAETLLQEAGFRVRVARSIDDLSESVTDATGVLLIAEEALRQPAREVLLAKLGEQPTWSDIPTIILTGEGELSRVIPEPLRGLTSQANVTLIERPVRIATLVTSIRSALRARARQLDLRDYLIERLESEKALRQAQEDAETANHAKSNFLTTMSHELRTPLNAIAGYTELLMLEIAGPITTRQRQQLERIEKSERHLLALINDVLNFAKLEAGQVKLDMREVDLAGLVHDLEAFVSPQMLAKSLRYTEVIEGPLVTRTDAEKVRQILLNLLSNAVKFTRDGGEIRIVAQRGGGQITITVSDNGEGISADRLEDIFEPFVQVGRTFNSPSEGTGLGLSISRDLAKRLGGNLTCTSEPGVGSAFTLALPVKED